MTSNMFATVRKYNAIPTLVEDLIKKQDDIKSVLRPINGFHAYYLLKTSDGALSMTVCEDRAGAEESNRVEATWFKDKFPTFSTRPPEISSGEVRITLEREPVKATA